MRFQHSIRMHTMLIALRLALASTSPVPPKVFRRHVSSVALGASRQQRVDTTQQLPCVGRVCRCEQHGLTRLVLGREQVFANGRALVAFGFDEGVAGWRVWVWLVWSVWSVWSVCWTARVVRGVVGVRVEGGVGGHRRCDRCGRCHRRVNRVFSVVYKSSCWLGELLPRLWSQSRCSGVVHTQPVDVE